MFLSWVKVVDLLRHSERAYEKASNWIQIFTEGWDVCVTEKLYRAFSTKPFKGTSVGLELAQLITTLAAFPSIHMVHNHLNSSFSGHDTIFWLLKAQGAYRSIYVEENSTYNKLNNNFRNKLIRLHLLHPKA